MIFGPLFMVLFLAAGIALIVVIVRGLAGPWTRTTPRVESGQSPIDILKERYARGEINKDEFDERRRVIGV